MSTVQSLILTGYGINCEEEMAAAYELAGSQSCIHHINAVFSGEVSIHDFDIVNFPGGFSFGDDIASGKVLANMIRYKRLLQGATLLTEMQRFIQAGKFILGVCNGFQVLTRLGLLPNTAGTFEQEATLLMNDNGKFTNDWVNLRVENQLSPFLQGIEKIYLPIRHGEGKLFFKDTQIKKEVLARGLNCLSYEVNPNGSQLNCAGLTDPTRQVFGLMPHPEAFLSFYNHPGWNSIRRARRKEELPGEGTKIFSNIVNHIISKRSVR